MIRAACILLLALLFAVPATAQTVWRNPYTGGTWNNPGSCLLDTMIRNQMNRRMLERSIGRQATSPPSTPRTTHAQRLTFKASPNLQNEEKLAASLTSDPKDRRELTSFFREALRSYRTGAAQAGRAEDVGNALALCVLTTYGVANGCDFSQPAYRAVLRQMDDALADMPGLRQASDEQRQTMAETMVMIAVFIAAGYEQGSKDAAARAAFVQLAEASFKNLTGLDPHAVTLTDQGLRAR